jgi:hypothetical protein
MIHLLLYVLIVGVACGLVWWLCDYLPIPEPFNKILKVITVVVFVIIVIYLLLGLVNRIPANLP